MDEKPTPPTTASPKPVQKIDVIYMAFWVKNGNDVPLQVDTPDFGLQYLMAFSEDGLQDLIDSTNACATADQQTYVVRKFGPWQEVAVCRPEIVRLAKSAEMPS